MITKSFSKKVTFGDVTNVDYDTAKDVVIYHHNDLDGKTGAFILGKTSGTSPVVYYECDYNTRKISSHEVDFSTVGLAIVVDLSDIESLLIIGKELSDKKIPLIWLDHHITSLKNIDTFTSAFKSEIKSGLFSGIVDISKCGTKIAYETFGSAFINTMNGAVKESVASKFVTLVDDYDRWVKQYPESDYLNTYMYNSSMMYPDSDLFIKLFCSEDELDKAIKFGKAFDKLAKEKNKVMYDAFSYKTTICGLSAVVVNGYGNSSVFGEHLDEFEITAVLHRRNNMWEFTLFTSRDDVNCAEICETHYNGGGHVKAAGGRSIERPF